MSNPVTPEEVVAALDIVIRWYRETSTSENWRIDIQGIESDRDGMVQLVEQAK